MDRGNVERNPGKIWAAGKKWIKHQWLSGPKTQSNPLSLAVQIVSCPNPLPTAHSRVKASTRWCWAHNHEEKTSAKQRWGRGGPPQFASKNSPTVRDARYQTALEKRINEKEVHTCKIKMDYRYRYRYRWASLVGQLVRNPPAMQAQVRSLGWENPLEEGMTVHSSVLAWRIPWTEESGRLQSRGSQRLGHNRVTKHSTA